MHSPAVVRAKLRSLPDTIKRVLLEMIGRTELPRTFAVLRCVEKAAIVPKQMGESIASKLLQMVCPVVATMKDVGLLCDTLFVTLLIRASALIQSQHPIRKFELHKIIMDERSSDAQQDTAIGKLLVTQGGYLTLQDAAEFTSDGLQKTVFPVHQSDMLVSDEEQDASRQLRAVCPVVATMKEAGLCDTSYAKLLIRTKQLIKSQHHNRAFNLYRRIIDEKSTSATKEAALRVFLVTQGGYFSSPEFGCNQRAWLRWKEQFPPGASPSPAPMQLQIRSRTGGKYAVHW
jgi:hypothetical protein